MFHPLAVRSVDPDITIPRPELIGRLRAGGKPATIRVMKVPANVFDVAGDL
jgi:hypothetical protein